MSSQAISIALIDALLFRVDLLLISCPPFSSLTLSVQEHCIRTALFLLWLLKRWILKNVVSIPLKHTSKPEIAALVYRTDSLFWLFIEC